MKDFPRSGHHSRPTPSPTSAPPLLAQAAVRLLLGLLPTFARPLRRLLSRTLHTPGTV